MEHGGLADLDGDGLCSTTYQKEKPFQLQLILEYQCNLSCGQDVFDRVWTSDQAYRYL